MKSYRAVFLGILIFFVLFFLSIFLGNSSLGFTEGIEVFFNMIKGKTSPSSSVLIIKLVRFPRTLAAVFCGAALSVSGLILQISLNNALASPKIIGINSGAGLFSLISALFFPFNGFFQSSASLLGALVSVFAVYLVSLKSGISKTTLILAGVAVSSMMNAVIDVLITLKPEIVSDKVSFSLGGFQNLNISSFKIAFPLIFTGCIILVFLSDSIDLFLLGDEVAFSLGVNVKVLRIISIAIASVLASAAVSVSGLLGGVGLLIPNFIRLLGIKKTKQNLFLCMIFGSDFLLLCDLLSRILFFPYELPVGLFLSFMGSPFFIWMLISRKKRLGL